MEYVIIGLLIIVIGMQSVIILKKKSDSIVQVEKYLNDQKEAIVKEFNLEFNRNNKDVIEELNKNNRAMLEDLNKINIMVIKELATFKEVIIANLTTNNTINLKEQEKFKENMMKFLDEKINNYTNRLNQEMDKLNDKVEKKLTEGFEKTSKTFVDIMERLQKIDDAQKQIEKLSTNIVSLQDVLTDKRSRGAFGEVQLNNILESLFGENNRRIFEEQYVLSNGTRVDCILHLPEPLGELAIDSKFPLENYQKMFNPDLSETERLQAKKQFKQDVKKHIDDISSKYIIPTVTADQAIMFLPSEAIFAEINAYHEDIIAHSQNKKVWIASPTTLMSLLTTVQVVLKNMERDKYSKIIQEELIKLSEEFERYQIRWEKLANSIDSVSKNVKDLNTTSKKISSRFENISNVQLDNEEETIKIAG